MMKAKSNVGIRFGGHTPGGHARRSLVYVGESQATSDRVDGYNAYWIESLTSTSASFANSLPFWRKSEKDSR